MEKSVSELEDCVGFKSVASEHIYLATIVPGYLEEVWHLTSLIQKFHKWFDTVFVDFHFERIPKIQTSFSLK